MNNLLVFRSVFVFLAVLHKTCTALTSAENSYGVSDSSKEKEDLSENTSDLSDNTRAEKCDKNNPSFQCLLELEDLASSTDADPLAYGKDYLSDPSSVENTKLFGTNNLKKLNDHKKIPENIYDAEVKAGSMADLFGTNPDNYNPSIFEDYGRRFVPQYPYIEVKDENDVEGIKKNLQQTPKRTRKSKSKKSFQKRKKSRQLKPKKSFQKRKKSRQLKQKKNHKESQEYHHNSIIPKKAPSELVLAIAKESKLLEDSKPINPTEELINKESLRTGEYWDGVWKEEVNPEAVLRTQKKNKKNHKESQEYYRNSIIPKKAPRDLVLAIAKESKLLEDSKPINPTEELINKESLRTGKYWDGVWKEEVNPEAILRTQKKYRKQALKKKQSPKLDTVIANIMPESKLYHLVSSLKKVSPRLLYIVNNKEEIL